MMNTHESHIYNRIIKRVRPQSHNQIIYIQGLNTCPLNLDECTELDTQKDFFMNDVYAEALEIYQAISVQTQLNSQSISHCFDSES